MRYLGGKSRIAKSLTQYLNRELKEGQTFVDLFCGSCKIIELVDKNRKLIANDINPYLIDMFKAVQTGWLPPTSCTEDEYKYIKLHKDENTALTGFVGFACSFAGYFFTNYARSKTRNYCMEGYNSIVKQKKKIKDIHFVCDSYENVEIPLGSMIYCDIPYKSDIKRYIGIFDHDDFYSWVRLNSKNYDIYISEYIENVPPDFTIVWEKECKQDVKNPNISRQKSTTECLIKYNG